MRKIAVLSTAAATAFASTPPAATTPATDAPKAKKPRGPDPQLTAVHTGLTMPTRVSKRGSKSIYPFDSLTAVGMSFGVKNKDAKSLSSVISNANKKAVKDRVDANGNPVFKMTDIKDANGAVVGQTPTTERETDVTAKYFAVDVDAAMKKQIAGTPLEGSKAIVFREQ